VGSAERLAAPAPAADIHASQVARTHTAAADWQQVWMTHAPKSISAMMISATMMMATMKTLMPRTTALHRSLSWG
jgi:hypothetical protein